MERGKQPTQTSQQKIKGLWVSGILTLIPKIQLLWLIKEYNMYIYFRAKNDQTMPYDIIWQIIFSNFSCMFLNPNNFSNLNYNCSNHLDMRNLQEQVKKAFCYQKLFWPFTVWINCSSDLKTFANSRPSASNFKSFSRSVEQFFLTVGQNNFGNKIPFLTFPADF